MDATEILDAEDNITIADAEAYANALIEKASLIKKDYGNLIENSASLGETDLITEQNKAIVAPILTTAMKAKVIESINTEVSIADIVAARTGE